MEGRRKKNKFKEQRHQGKQSAFLWLLREKEAWRSGSRGSGCWERGTLSKLWPGGWRGQVHFWWWKGSCVLEIEASKTPTVKVTLPHQGLVALIWQVLEPHTKEGDHKRPHLICDQGGGSSHGSRAGRVPGRHPALGQWAQGSPFDERGGILWSQSELETTKAMESSEGVPKTRAERENWWVCCIPALKGL